MLSPRENALAILHGEQPDYYGDFMDALRWIPDPVFAADMIPQDGMPHKDAWGTVKVFPLNAPGAHPNLNRDNVVIRDIEEWEKYLKVPSLDALDWESAKEAADSIDRNQYFAALFMATGLFERSHFLMGMEDALCNYLEYPEEMDSLLSVICDYKIREIEMAAEYYNPDVFFYQDDWGSKQNLFLPPRIWRDLIKPYTAKIANAIHDAGGIYVHHADCICQPIVHDMVDIRVDIWQGVIPENDIVGIQHATKGKLPMIGGIDVPAIDIDGMPESKIRSEVRRAIDTYCPAGRFYPGMPGGACYVKRNDAIVREELAVYGKLWAEQHPIR